MLSRWKPGPGLPESAVCEKTAAVRISRKARTNRKQRMRELSLGGRCGATPAILCRKLCPSTPALSPLPAAGKLFREFWRGREYSSSWIFCCGTIFGILRIKLYRSQVRVCQEYRSPRNLGLFHGSAHATSPPSAHRIAPLIVDLEHPLGTDAAAFGCGRGVRHHLLHPDTRQRSLRPLHPAPPPAHCRRHRGAAGGPVAVQPAAAGARPELSSLDGAFLFAGSRAGVNRGVR